MRITGCSSAEFSAFSPFFAGWVVSSAIAGQKSFQAAVSGAGSDVEEADVLGVALDEGAPCLDVLTHQHR
ncbi:hypothetical protein, partial [Streptomyces nojiriensis]|uniref:hypothetical protein n=1 Tax=Streptomyces nojiriensis TaxID=66374 RepID=UPI0036CCC415